MVVMSPMNESELRNMMYSAQLEKNAGPISIRYPRGQGVMVDWKTAFQEIEMGKGRIIKEGKDIALLTIGHIGNYVIDISPVLLKQGVDVAHYDLRFVKPLDEALLHEVFKKHDKVITVENGCIQGGVGSAVLEFMSDNGYKAEVKRLGIPDRFIEHGKPIELHKECGFDKEGIINTIKSMVFQEALIR